MDAIETSECPVCGGLFKMTAIEQHVNECLNAADVHSEENRLSKKRKSTEMTESAWGCLHPHKNQNETESREPDDVNKNKRIKTVKSEENSHSKSPILIEEDSNSGGSVDIISDNLLQVQNSTKNNAIEQSSPFQSTRPTKPLLDSSSGSKSSFSLKKTIENKLKSDASIKSANLNRWSSSSSDSPSTMNPFFQKRTKDMTSSSKSFSPLAEQMRPSSLDNYIGQDKAVGKKSLLHSLLLSDHLPSMILWGPPGCGKTTLARIIAARCKDKGNAKFVQLSATTSGVNDVKEVIKVAKNDKKMLRRKTVLFLDEIHRFNKTQQDTLLPHVEDGTVILIGATTENPSFQVNSALLSRCRVIVLEKLCTEALKKILKAALNKMGAKVYDTEDDIEIDGAEDRSAEPEVWVENQAIEVLANLCDGDARSSLNSLQMAIQSQIGAFKNSNQRNGRDCVVMVTADHIKEGLQRSHIKYDKTGEEHYNMISALQKSIRGSDSNGALYWLMRMLEGGEDPLYIARRLVRTASEDIGLADPLALNQSVAAFQACHFIGMPECGVILAQCAIYLARAPKSVEVTEAYSRVKQCIQQHEGALPSVPLHLRNPTSKLNTSLGYGKDYKYNPAFKTPVKQDYLPPELIGKDFFT